MKLALPVVILLVAWLTIRLARKRKLPRWAPVVPMVLLAGVIVATVRYCAFRIERARADIERARETARMLEGAMARYEADKGLASAVAAPFGGGEFIDAVEFIVDQANHGDTSTLRQAANDARYCIAEVDQSFNELELLVYSQPTPCRAMFRTLGEPADLAEAGVTFENETQRTTAQRPAGTPGGPACRQWQVTRLDVEVPQKKPSGKPWDAGSPAPDLYFQLKVGAGKRHRSPKKQDSYQLTWRPSTPITTIPGTTVQVHVYDADLVEDDSVFGWEAEVPENLARAWVVGERPNAVELSMKCAR